MHQHHERADRTTTVDLESWIWCETRKICGIPHARIRGHPIHWPHFHEQATPTAISKRADCPDSTRTLARCNLDGRLPVWHDIGVKEYCSLTTSTTAGGNDDERRRASHCIVFLSPPLLSRVTLALLAAADKGITPPPHRISHCTSHEPLTPSPTPRLSLMSCPFTIARSDANSYTD